MSNSYWNILIAAEGNKDFKNISVTEEVARDAETL